LGAISVSLVLKQMKREDRVNVVVLDACRDNPFAAALARNKTRAIVGERGLSRIEGDLARGTLIAFASDPKSTALDGAPGEHSPFTAAFLSHVFDQGVSIDTVMSRVRTAKAPVCHSVKRVASAPVATAAAAPAANPRCNGNPQWCRLAGLPDDSGAVPTGPPPGFMGGYVTGVGARMLMRGFRHY